MKKYIQAECIDTLKETIILQKMLLMIVKLGERMVVYKTLYEREDKKKLWIRPEKMFLSTISKRPDNITGQTHRFELVKDLEKNYLK